jgi:hypothetical protein
MNNEDDFTFDISSTLNIGDITISDSSKDTITIDLGNNMTSTFDTTYTVDSSNMYTGTTDVNIDWIYNKINIDPDKVENMCKEYPALEKVWRNFKSVYDMVLQDYEGKKKAGELDDDIPF